VEKQANTFGQTDFVTCTAVVSPSSQQAAVPEMQEQRGIAEFSTFPRPLLLLLVILGLYFDVRVLSSRPIAKGNGSMLY